MGKDPIFKDKRKLSLGYVPKKLVDREGEMRTLVRWFGPVLRGRADQKATILGPPGSGKTALSLVFCRELETYAENRGNTLTPSRVGCGRWNSSWQVLGDLLHSCAPGESHEGIGEPEILNLVEEKLIGDESRHIFVLDDLGSLVRKENPNFLYYLTRVREESGENGNLSLIVTFENEETLEKLDEATRSTLFHNYLRLDGYGREQIFKILKERGNAALNPRAVGEGVLDVITDRASGPGDVGYALAALRKSGEICEREGEERILPNHAREAIHRLDGGVRKKDLEGLSEHEVLVLRALAEFLLSSGGSPPMAGQLFRSYRDVCEEEGKKARGYSSFWQYVGDLLERGLIEAEVSRGGHQGESRVISLPGTDPEMTKKDLDARL